ncbi:hypothetical protein DB88DRAFT_486665 [Papiliotrema laurentii]|uniref:Dynactin subunit 6 n=1 Tax=Papiliotrema laurentii TaxID=5418 RepID=A0AAD9L5V7_PAPLA|nr:hypothetical protein DB88DRAFT_486665 [Papiliotrema laurentii]
MSAPATHAPTPSAKLTAHSTALICQDTNLQGEITIGAGCIVHPKASILALGGPIVIGQNCVIEETAAIVNKTQGVMSIGEGNVFMIGSRVESPRVGDFNVFHPRSFASSLVHVTDHCNLGAGTVALPLDPMGTDTLAPYTVVYGADSSRRVWDGSGETAELDLRQKHTEYLREIMPKYNRMRAA